jgi:hypothetical protein
LCTETRFACSAVLGYGGQDQNRSSGRGVLQDVEPAREEGSVPLAWRRCTGWEASLVQRPQLLAQKFYGIPGR